MNAAAPAIVAAAGPLGVRERETLLLLSDLLMWLADLEHSGCEPPGASYFGEQIRQAISAAALMPSTGAAAEEN